MYGLERLKDGFPFSLRLLREIHNILLSGGRGSKKLPGKFRRSQNWIGGTRPGNALFVPPPVDYLNDCLSHSFLDGNGRLGRLLVTLLLCHNEILNAPILYLSLYLNQNRHIYYELLQEVRIHGNWETWLEFFLEGIHKSVM
ncbi:MAG TPA: hypothetical protein LFW14_06495 [Rickettsia endosymbiont of Degeeriella rufa]|nr:hypothetical protein [Rickettsia endosymbiont of Degeeriella rufa]